MRSVLADAGRPALRAVDPCLHGQSAWLVNYAERHRAGLRVGTFLTEGTANFLVHQRMAKSQQMCWPRRGADLLLRLRCAVDNGALGCSFGHTPLSQFPARPRHRQRRRDPQSLDSPARKLLIALWRFATQDVIPEGVVMKSAS